MGLTIATNQIVPFVGILLSIAWHITKRPVNQPDIELQVLPFLVQIFLGLSFLTYATNQHDVFVYAQHIPTLASAVIITLRFHPYLRKRVRRSHEIISLVGVLVITIVTLAAAISPYEAANAGMYATGAVAAAATLAWAAVTLRESVRIALAITEFSPPVVEFATAALATAHGLVWAAYGYYYASDGFVSLTNLVLAVVGVVQLVLYVFGLFRRGGLDLGWDSDEYPEETDDAIVGRLNRANTLSSIGSRPRSTHSSSATARRGSSYDMQAIGEPTIRGSVQEASYKASAAGAIDLEKSSEELEGSQLE
ncbi:hypothetical protein HK405_008736 [Cladochytrium tenue]|nr:hypothetical protein HK405_008736 [Cladochytrium tenue]